jgi:hypothetical protein
MRAPMGLAIPDGSFPPIRIYSGIFVFINGPHGPRFAYCANRHAPWCERSRRRALRVRAIKNPPGLFIALVWLLLWFLLGININNLASPHIVASLRIYGPKTHGAKSTMASSEGILYTKTSSSTPERKAQRETKIHTLLLGLSLSSAMGCLPCDSSMRSLVTLAGKLGVELTRGTTAGMGATCAICALRAQRELPFLLTLLRFSPMVASTSG